jgi:hypothetical protein
MRRSFKVIEGAAMLLGLALLIIGLIVLIACEKGEEFLNKIIKGEKSPID